MMISIEVIIKLEYGPYDLAFPVIVTTLQTWGIY